MNELQLQALLPFIMLATASMIVILLIAFRLSHTVIQLVGFAMMCMVVTCMWLVRYSLPQHLKPLLIIDGFAAIATGIIIFSVLFVGLFSYIYFEEREENPKEYYILLFLATLGAATLTISNHFISLFLGLEILSVSLYALIAYLRNRNNAVEAGMKYLMLAAVSSAFLLLGMALIYFETGSMEFDTIAAKIGTTGSNVLITLGIGTMLVAVGFKLAFVPFHLWAADIYEGAPPPVTAFIATVSKIGVFVILLRFAESVKLQTIPLNQTIFSSIAIASMVVGNILALQQKNIKRLLAYSSIAHFGYLLVAFLTSNIAGAMFYLFAYSITLLSAFGIITLLSTKQKDADDLSYYQGLFWRQPLLAIILIVAILSLAGIPLTVGFPAKFLVLLVGVGKSLWIPLIVMILTSVVGMFYYLRIINTLFATPDTSTKRDTIVHPFFYFATYSSLTILMVLILFFGIFPGMLINMIWNFLFLG